MSSSETSDLANALWVACSTLRPHPRNPRRNDGRALASVMVSMRRFGFVAPIVLWREGQVIVAGHTRHKAAMAILERDPKFTFPGAPGPGLVPVIQQSFTSEAEALAYLLADNRASELSEWNEPERAAFIRDLAQTSNVLELGFTPDELAVYLPPPEDFTVDPSWVQPAAPSNRPPTSPSSVAFGAAAAPVNAAPPAPVPPQNQTTDAAGPVGSTLAAPSAVTSPTAAAGGETNAEAGANSEAAPGSDVSSAAPAGDGGTPTIGTMTMPSSVGRTSVPVLRWGSTTFPMSVDSAAALEEKLQQWVRDHGSLMGAGAHLARCF